METASFHNIVRQLTDDQTPRVWSLLVTVFGELAQEKGAQISGLMLRHIRERIGIKPEAMRVALHRLRKDGWIENERKGRTSAHFLTDWGRAQSAAASPRIYSRAPTVTHAWLVLFDPSQPHGHVDASGVWMSSNLLISGEAMPGSDRFVTRLDDTSVIPDWMKNKICDAKTRATSQAFSRTLQSVQTELKKLSDLSSLEQAVLRILLVHAWRRIVLKTPVLPDFVFPDDWCGPQCREQMSGLLNQFPKQGLAELETAIKKNAQP